MIRDALVWLLATTQPRNFARNGRDFAALPDDHTLVEIETKSPARRHVFHDVADFAEHLNRHADPSATDVLFDGNVGRVSAWFVPRSAGADLVHCELRLHPRWARWKAVLGRPVDQKALYRHLMASPVEDSAPLVSAKGEMLGLQVHELAGAVKSIQVKKGLSLEAVLDDRGNYAVRSSGESTDTSVRVPHAIEIRVPIYRLRHDERVYAIEVQVDVDTDGTPCPAFTLVAPGLDLVLAQAQQDAAAYLRSHLLDGFLVGLGAHVTAEVAV